MVQREDDGQRRTHEPCDRVSRIEVADMKEHIAPRDSILYGAIVPLSKGAA